MTRKEKKSESLDVRLPHSVKQEFMQTASARGETASEAVRRFIETYLNETPSGSTSTPIGSLMTMAKPHLTKLAAMTGAIAAGAFALTLMPTAVADGSAFERLDKNADGAITPGEIGTDDEILFEALDKDQSGTITPDELQSKTTIIRVTEEGVFEGSGETQLRVFRSEGESDGDVHDRVIAFLNDREIDLESTEHQKLRVFFIEDDEGEVVVDDE